jgi:hypothetical protein
MIMTDKLERMWKEVVMACFKTLKRDLLGGTEGNHEQPLSGW